MEIPRHLRVLRLKPLYQTIKTPFFGASLNAPETQMKPTDFASFIALSHVQWFVIKDECNKWHFFQKHNIATVIQGAHYAQVSMCFASYTNTRYDLYTDDR